MANKRRLKIGVICSAGGAPFFTAADLAVRTSFLDYADLTLITDRLCGAEAEADSRSVYRQRLEEKDRVQFSTKACTILQERGVDLVLLYFARLISAELFSVIPSLNVHPSLLPAFAGINALKQAVQYPVPIIGSTLHAVSAGVDDGSIVAQVATPALGTFTADELGPLSFLHKVYLTLCAIDLVANDLLVIKPASETVVLSEGLRVTASAAPALQTPSLVSAFSDFQKTRSALEGYLVP